MTNDQVPMTDEKKARLLVIGAWYFEFVWLLVLGHWSFDF